MSPAIRAATSSARCMRWLKPADRRPGPRRGRCISPRTPSSRASWACPTVLDDRRTATMVRLAPAPAEQGRRGRRRPPLQGRQASSATSRRSACPSAAGWPSPAMSRCRSCSTSAARSMRRSGDRADRPAARATRDGRPFEETVHGRRPRRARIRSRGRAVATPRSCARRSGARSAPRSPRPGARSRFARSSSRSYDGAMIGRLNHVAIAVPDLAAAAALYRDDARRQRLRRRCRSRSTASRSSSSTCPTPRSS